MPRVNLRIAVSSLDSANAGRPASLSGVPTITGTMRDGQTPVAAWPSVVNGKPVTNTATYIVRYTTDGGDSFVVAKQGSTPQTMDALTSADIGRQYQLVMRAYNAANLVEAEPQVISALSAVVTAIAVIAPTFASGPTLTGTPANGQVMAVAFTTAGSATITSEIRWFINAGEVVGQTATTWTGLGLVAGDQVKAQVRLTNAGGITAWTDSNLLLVATGGAIAQTATFGTVTPAGSGGWRPQLASGAVEALTSYNSLTGGSLGAYVPSIVSGRLVFTGGGAGAPNGAVLNCTGASGRVYNVTIATAAARKDIAAVSDITAAAGVTANLGLTLVVRQNAQIPPQTTWLNASGSQALMDSGLLSPITVVGEGYDVVADNYHPSEFHVSTMDAYFPSGFTARGLVFANDHNAGCLIFRTNSSRKARSQAVYGCRMQIDFNVDNADPDGPQTTWGVVTNPTTGKITRGFGSTGYNKARGIYVTGGGCRDFTFNDNRFYGLYIQAEISVTTTVTHAGNIHGDCYYDFVKMALSTDATGGVAYEGANLISKMRAYSVYESAATAPHVDGDQAGGNLNAALTFFSDARVYWHTLDLPVQSRFYADRASAAAGGHRVSFRAEAQIGRTPHSLSVTWPDNVNVVGCIIAPGPQYLSRMPISSAGSASQMPVLGAGKDGDGGAVGTHRFDRMYSRTAPATSGGLVGSGPIGPDPSSIIVTNSVAYDGYTETDLAQDFYHWSSWANLPEMPTYAQSFEYITRPVLGSDLADISFWGEVTLPADGAGSTYTISDTLRPVPVLSALTVTDAASAAFTVTQSLDDHVAMFWSVFSAQTTSPEEIKQGRRWTGSAWVGAVNYGYVQAVRGTSSVAGGGTAALASGTYWLCMVQYNGIKKTGVATVQFTVP